MNQIDVLFDVMDANNFYRMPTIKKADVEKYMTSKAYNMDELLGRTYGGKTLGKIPGIIVRTIITNMTTHEDWTIGYAYTLYSKPIVDEVLRHWARIIYDNTVAYLDIGMPDMVSAIFSEVSIQKGCLITGVPVISVSAKVNQDCTIRQLRDALDSFKRYAKTKVMSSSHTIVDCTLKDINVKLDRVECIFVVI